MHARIGIDFDNTIAGFDEVFIETARRMGLVNDDFRGAKRDLRDTIRRLPDGELAWQRLQGRVYGAGMLSARLIDGVDAFLQRCRTRGEEVSIVSHKTEYGHYDPERINLRQTALDWMTARGFFRQDGYGLRPDHVFFETTREEKIGRIAALGCTVFIDDLEEVLLDPTFPRGVGRILFTESRNALPPDIVQCRTWQEIQQVVFGSSADQDLDTVATTASACLGVPVKNVERVTPIAYRGRNSRIFRIDSGGEAFALKQYPSRQDDPRDRLHAEATALRLMQRHGIDTVPRIVSINPEQGCLLLSWIDGSPVDVAGDRDIDAADRFLTAVHELRHEPEAEHLPPAAEACLSGAEIERQILARLGRLNERRAYEPELASLIDRSFVQTLNDVLARVRSRISDVGLAYDVPLSRHLQSLIPADFGFHNSLRRPDGTLVFLDFEYFGWDDPVKLTADFLLHPGMTLAPAARNRFREAAERRYADDPCFGVRLDALYPLFGLRWVLVLLNEFLPERWELRVKMGAATDWAEVKRRQLVRARELLGRISYQAEGAAHTSEF